MWSLYSRLLYVFYCFGKPSTQCHDYCSLLLETHKGHLTPSSYILYIDPMLLEKLNGFSYEKSSEICDFIINSFIESRFDRVTIIYNEFKNVAVQKTVSENFLPVSQENDSQDSANNNYIFEPEKNKIIDNL